MICVLTQNPSDGPELPSLDVKSVLIMYKFIRRINASGTSQICIRRVPAELSLDREMQPPAQDRLGHWQEAAGMASLEC